MADPTNAQIAAALDELGDLYELDGAVSYRVIAYRNAAKAVRESSVSIIAMTREGRVTSVPGIGKTLEDKLRALDETGDIPALIKLRAKFPPGLVELVRLPGFGPKRARKLFDELGIDSLDALAGRMGAERLHDAVGELQRAVEEHLRARVGVARPRRERRQDRLLELRAEAAHVAQALGLRGLLEGGERVDAQLVEEAAGALGPEAGQVRHVEEPGRELAAQALERGDVPRLEQRLELLLQRAPDPRELGHGPGARHGRHGPRRLAHRLSRVPVGQDPVHDGAVELVEVGKLVEERGDRGVRRVGHAGVL